MSWVSKVRSEDNKIACNFVSFVDDFRSGGPTAVEAWRAASHIAKKLNFLGLQDATRKRRNSSQHPGAWAGCIVYTGNNGVFVTISEKKWKKALGMLDEIEDMIRKNRHKLDRKR